jgi:hypothetical protein
MGSQDLLCLARHAAVQRPSRKTEPADASPKSPSGKFEAAGRPTRDISWETPVTGIGAGKSLESSHVRVPPGRLSA